MSNTHIPDAAPQSTAPAYLRIPANIISYAFHPIFMPVVMTLVLYRLAPVNFAGIDSMAFLFWFGIIFINTLFFPLVIIALLKKLEFISSIQMNSPKDRIIPLIGVMTCYFWAYLIFKNKDYAFVLQVLLLGNFWATMAVFMINIFLKISMHAVAAGGMVGIIIVLMILSPVNMAIPLFLALLIAGIIGTARLVLGAHRPAEVWLGYIIGILAEVGAYYYLV